MRGSWWSPCPSSRVPGQVRPSYVPPSSSSLLPLWFDGAPLLHAAFHTSAMACSRALALCVVAAALLPCKAAGQGNILSLVDPLIGTTNGGHVFPGATLPFGMAKAGADVNVENQGGFSTGQDTGNITGFSHLHDSGTGGVRTRLHPYLPLQKDDESEMNILSSLDPL